MDVQPAGRLETLRMKDIELSDFEEKRERINLGDLKGNEFRIVARDIGTNEKILDKKVSSAVERVKKSGVINSFGDQRFGGVREVTHIVGKSIIGNDLKAAVWNYLTITSHNEPSQTRRFRKDLAASGDVRKALNEIPRNLGFEKLLLEHLVRKPNDHAGALRHLPKKLRKMFVHAYQAYLWNVMAENFHEESIPLIGYDTKIKDPKISKFLEKEGIKPEDFRIRPMPELSSEGASRERVIYPEGIGYEIGKDELNKNKRKVILKFIIPKGSYATVVVRDIMKGIE